MSSSFWKYYFGTVSRPLDNFRLLLKEKKSLHFAFLSVALCAFTYTLVYTFLILGGGRPYKPWLNIPEESYYQWNLFFCGPSMFLGWILASGVVHLCSKLIKGEGSFENCLVVFGFGIGLASWTTGVHDLITSFLGAIHVIDQNAYETQLNSPSFWRSLLWIQMLAYVVCFVILFGKGLKAAYHLNRPAASILGTLGFLIYQFFFFIFNR